MEKTNYRIPALSVAKITPDETNFDTSNFNVWWIKPGVQDVLNVAEEFGIVTLGPYVHDAYIRLEVIEGAVAFEIVGSAAPIVPIALSDYIGGGGASDPLVLQNGLSVGTQFIVDQFGITLNSNEFDVAVNFNDPEANYRGDIGHKGLFFQANQISADKTASIQMNGANSSSVFRVVVDDTSNVLTAIMSGLPTADPVTPNRLWNDAGTLKVSTGV